MTYWLVGIKPIGPERPHSQVYEEVLALLDSLTPWGGPVNADATIEAEGFLGVSREVIYRDLVARRNANPRLRGRPAFPFPSVLVALYYALGGDVQRLYDRLVEVGWPDLPGSYSSFWRAWNRLDPGLKDFMRTSTDGLMNRYPFEEWVIEERNRVWHMDCVRLKIRTAKKDSRRSKPQWRLQEAWVILVWEASTRYCLAAAVIDGPPTSEHVQGVLASAMRLRPEGPQGVVVGGVPAQVITDNGKEFIAAATTRLLAKVAAEQRVTRPHMKQLNGKAERNGKTFSEELIAGLPNQTRAPIKWNKSGTMTVVLERSVSAAALHRRAQELREWWNWKRRHRMIKATPGAAMASKSDPINVVAAGILEPYFPVAERDDGKVTYDRGRIIHDGRVYLLAGYDNAASDSQKLTIRHPHGDNSVLFGFYWEGQFAGRYFGTFTRADSRTPEDSVSLDNYRVRHTNLAADLAAVGAIFQVAIEGADAVETARLLYGDTLDHVQDYAWLQDCLVEYGAVLLRKRSDDEKALRAAAKRVPRPSRRSRRRTKVAPGQGLLFVEVDGRYLNADHAA